MEDMVDLVEPPFSKAGNGVGSVRADKMPTNVEEGKSPTRRRIILWTPQASWLLVVDQWVLVLVRSIWLCGICLFCELM